ncbi:1818_t:CDS:10 [Acaulospora colombiana]|uniref:1818_t:CDS:1 n=1 Tax=Acaulospora colombiana TaxID=27376 RepID=A0ACA9NH92_9GLOM|nr:1818_t:CDS:10 [Acaulospora colombiana]
MRSLLFHRIVKPKVPTNLHSYATASKQTEPSTFSIFNRNTKRLQKDRSASDVESSRQVDYIKDEIAYRIVDRLLDIKRKFEVVVDLGSGCGHVVKHIDGDLIGNISQRSHDITEKMLNRDKDVKYDVEVERMILDEESLPFEENTLEAVLSNLSLHWVNDLPGAMIQIRRSLKPDGVFLASMFGGDTLFELRTSLQLAELEREGGISPRVSPMTDVRDVGSLLSRAGFTLTTVDVDDLVVNYPTMFELIQDLRAMGESNAVITRRPFLKRDTLLAAASIYKELYGKPDETIPATFQIGWKPDSSQPKPKERGSAKSSLKEILEEKDRDQ